jgi:hypothetical protein
MGTDVFSLEDAHEIIDELAEHGDDLFQIMDAYLLYFSGEGRGGITVCV